MRRHPSSHLLAWPILLLAVLLPTQPLQAQNQEVAFELEGELEVDLKTGETVARQGARLTYGPWLLAADEIRYNDKTGEAEAISNVVLTRQGLRLIADRVIYRPLEPFAHIENFRAGNGEAYIEGSLLEGNPDNFTFNDVTFYPGEPGTFLFKAKADEMTIIDQKEFRGSGIGFRLGAVPFPPLPNISYPIDADTNYFDVQVDYSGHIGGSIGGEFRLPLSSSLQVGANIALTTKRGILIGPASEYYFEGREDGHFTKGELTSGYIDDDAEEVGLDVLGRPIDDQRFFAEWAHLQRWGEKASVTAVTRYWSDSEVTRDFYDDSFDRMQNPDSYLEANYRTDNLITTLFVRVSPNDFQRFTERLPELRFTLLPTALDRSWSHEGGLAFVKARSQLPPENEASYADASYGVTYHRKLRDGVHFQTKVGARSIHYFNTDAFDASGSGAPTPLSDQSGTLLLGDFGFDLSGTAVGLSEYRNRVWRIDGLRHVFNPVLSYRYQPALEELDFQPASLGQQDEFFNYLQPLAVSERRLITTLDEAHLARLRLNNRIQTRDENYGSRDLARIDFAFDYLVDDAPRGRNFSDLYMDMALTPAPWLELGAFTRYNFSDSSLQELNARIEFTDPRYWKIGFGSHFVAREPVFEPTISSKLEQYFLYGEYTFSENFKAFAVARYDERSDTFYEQSIGILQRALADYAIKYELRIYDGDRREDDYSIRIGVDLFRE